VGSVDGDTELVGEHAHDLLSAVPIFQEIGHASAGEAKVSRGGHVEDPSSSSASTCLTLEGAALVPLQPKSMRFPITACTLVVHSGDLVAMTCLKTPPIRVGREPGWSLGEVIRILAEHGLDVVYVFWDDTGRSGGSSEGSRISDGTIQLARPMPEIDEHSQSLMPVIGYRNFSDQIGDVVIDKFYVLVGNEAGDGQRAVTLQEENRGSAMFYLFRSCSPSERTAFAPLQGLTGDIILMREPNGSRT
jgi:hypothetical protein